MDFVTFMQKNWAWLLSFATVLLGGITYVYVRMRALERGVQALLRAQMINDYNHYSERGSAPIYARQSFENLWTQYEKLGKNGVMEDLHHKFLALPVEKKGETK